MNQEQNITSRNKTFSILLLIILIFSYIILMLFHLDYSYIDFGDGNYLYISSRIADGLRLYRDIVPPQPPCHLFLGAFLIKIGRILGNPLFTVRVFSILLHAAIAILIFITSINILRHTRCQSYHLIAFFSSLIYLFLPESFWWSIGYQSESLVIILLLLSFYFFIRGTKYNLIISAIFSVFACFTNMTAVPYVGFNALFLIIKKRKLCLFYIVPLIVLGLLFLLIMHVYSEGNYINAIFFNQLQTYSKNFITNGIARIVNEGKDVFTWEGAFIIFALLGILGFIKHSEHHFAEYIGWYSLFSILSIVYVTKGGTVDYIFTLAEPYVAIFSAMFLYNTFKKHIVSADKMSALQEKSTDNICPITKKLLSIFVFILILIISSFIGFFFIRNILIYREYLENPESKVLYIKENFIDKYSKPGDTILAPPYYVFLSNRLQIEEFSEHYIYTVKIRNEIVSGQEADGLKLLRKILSAIYHKQLPLIILNLNRGGIGYILVPDKLVKELSPSSNPPETQYLKDFIEQYYKPLLNTPMQCLNEYLQIYVPQ